VEDLEQGSAGDVGGDQIDVEGHQDKHGQLRERKHGSISTREQKVSTV